MSKEKAGMKVKLPSWFKEYIKREGKSHEKRHHKKRHHKEEHSYRVVKRKKYGSKKKKR